MNQKQEKLFTKDFTLVVIGQIISLFGNATVRFALPLYLLNLTGSSALYGAVTACAFIPSILLSPVGGMIADRVNKRNIMVILDFTTAAVILAFSLLMERGSLILLAAVTLMILYGIAGAYQPSVQASIPALACRENFMAANSVINMVSSFSSLLGPVFGGIFYSAYGLRPVLFVCAACFVLSAVMELFINIPFQKQETGGGMLKTAKKDFVESLRFVRKEKPVIIRCMLTVCGINLFLSAMLLVAVPYLITEVLAFQPVQANRLYGLAEGVMAAGGLAGGICTGIFAKRLKAGKAGAILIGCAVCVFPMGIALLLTPSAMASYTVITICCFAIMALSTVFTVQVMSVIQRETPEKLLGKVISVIMTVAMCAQPLGNAFYGVLFELCRGAEFAVVFFAGAVSLVIAVRSRKIFTNLMND